MPTAQLLGVSKRFGRRLALNNVSLSLAGPEIVGIVGPNGAGKTTMLRILAGLLRPSEGSVQLGAGQDVSYFGGERTLPPDASARRWMALWSPAISRATTSRAFGVLSRGTRQRIGLEAALVVSEPSLIVLDEPWEGLDPAASRWLADAIVTLRGSGHSIVVSSHRIHDLAPTCDRCQFMVDGRVAASIVCAGLEPDARVTQLFGAFDRARGEQ